VVATRLGSAPDQVGKHGGLADLGMPGRGEQRQRAAPGHLPQVLERWGALGVVEFLRLLHVGPHLGLARVRAVYMQERCPPPDQSREVLDGKFRQFTTAVCVLDASPTVTKYVYQLTAIRLYGHLATFCHHLCL
jgi:hypothetical protein